MHYKSSDFCLLMTATINPKGMKYLARSNVNERLDDYKKTKRTNKQTQNG